MNLTDSFLRILPEVVLTITGVVVMMLEAVLRRGVSRKPLGWLTVAGVLAALYASLGQFQLAPGTGYSGLVQTDAFSIFFHVLICAIVLVTLLVSLDSYGADSPNQGEYFALVVFGAVGMLFMTTASELLPASDGSTRASVITSSEFGFRSAAKLLAAGSGLLNSGL